MKTFLIRIGLFLPIVFFGVYVLLAVIGCIASACGAQDAFYCSVYCKLGVGIFTAAVLAVMYCQAKSCFRNS